jgi:probable rRNA maturation factor
VTHVVMIDVDPAYEDRVPSEVLRTLLEGVLDGEGVASGELTVQVYGDELLHELNLSFRGIDAPTDVLSFPSADDEFPAAEGDAYLGDVAISVPAAERNAALTGTPFERELRQLAVHGVLHLLGYGHDDDTSEARMRAREVAILGEWVHAIWDAPPTH